MRPTLQAKHVWLIVLILILGGCGGVVRAPVIDRDSGTAAKPGVSGPGTVRHTGRRPSYYVVRSGDTLYSIAWRYGNDYRELARWNGISPPFLIRPGERLRLRAPPERGHSETRSAALARGDGASASAAVQSDHGGRRAAPSAAKPTHAHGTISWHWPTRGKLIDEDTPLAKNGVDIAGTWGQPITASAAGKVVYSGSGLIGYGKLIIIKHNDVFLSAYAHNSKLLVKEGEAVKSGQKIAEMGRDGTRNAVLHFEIRRNGKPVNPLNYLPRQQ